MCVCVCVCVRKHLLSNQLQFFLITRNFITIPTVCRNIYHFVSPILRYGPSPVDPLWTAPPRLPLKAPRHQKINPRRGV